MERKKASDYPQELLDIFHEYQHGDIDRRTFMDRIGKFAVGGLTAVAIFESLRPNYAWAQQVPKDDARIKTEVATVQSPEGNGSIKGLFAKPANATGKLGAIGFCFGGGVVNNLAVRLGADLAAGAPFYGAPLSDENAAQIKTPMMLHYADPTKDTGIGARIPAYEAALKANNKQYQLFIYEGAQHGFHNDTTPRYDEAAAKLAWQRSLEFFNKNVRG